MPASLPPSDGPPIRKAMGRTISSEKAALEDSREADVAYRVGVRPRARHRAQKRPNPLVQPETCVSEFSICDAVLRVRTPVFSDTYPLPRA
jgi:hypothetical protein